MSRGRCVGGWKTKEKPHNMILLWWRFFYHFCQDFVSTFCHVSARGGAFGLDQGKPHIVALPGSTEHENSDWSTEIGIWVVGCSQKHMWNISQRIWEKDQFGLWGHYAVDDLSVCQELVKESTAPLGISHELNSQTQLPSNIEYIALQKGKLNPSK